MKGDVLVFLGIAIFFNYRLLDWNMVEYTMVFHNITVTEEVGLLFVTFNIVATPIDFCQDRNRFEGGTPWRCDCFIINVLM